jgi:predicted dehydrogenase
LAGKALGQEAPVPAAPAASPAPVAVSAEGAAAKASEAAAAARPLYGSLPIPPGSTVKELKIAIIGLGAEGQVLTDAIMRIPGIKVQAACDIWDYSLKRGSGMLTTHGHAVRTYEDYKDLLAKEQGLDAVVIATPDFVHAEQTIACLKAGYHVYCEKEMSNNLELAKQMVVTARETKKLLQIGHQRRSNPRYRHAIDKLIHEEKLIGRVTEAYGQWNRAKAEDLGWSKRIEIPADKLEKYGYASMQQFRNWRWYKKYGGGPMIDLGSHQIDIFTWVFGVTPKSVMAGGGIDFYKQHEWYDNVMAIYEYENAEGVSRGLYQVLTTTSNGGFYETFMGENGTLVISEVPQKGNHFLREANAPEWEPLVSRGLLSKPAAPAQPSEKSKNVVLDVRLSAELGSWSLPIEFNKPPHQAHLENFFDAIRLGTPLSCPGEIGYETAVAVLKVNNAVEAGQKLAFSPEEFKA